MPMKRLLLLLPLAAFSQTPPPKAPVVPTDLAPQIETLQPGVKMTLLAEHPAHPLEVLRRIDAGRGGACGHLTAQEPQGTA